MDDTTLGNTDKPKLEDLSHSQLVALLKEAMDRIESLEKKLSDTLPPKLPVPYSVRSAEDRKKRQKELDDKKKNRKKPLRSGRIKTEEKIAKAKRHVDVYPAGVDPRICTHSHIRPIIRIEAGQALWIAYHIYRAPNGKYAIVPGALGRSEFGLEIILAIAHQVYSLGLSFDKAIAPQKLSLKIEFWHSVRYAKWRRRNLRTRQPILFDYCEASC
jgi:hypothetical protein